MQEETETVGFEVVCRACDCIHNDCPVCKVHTQVNPIVIGPFGTCKQYESERIVQTKVT